METTRRLYYDEPRLERTEARVLAVEGEADKPVLVLDRTIFYPTGGGQPCDLGSLGGVALEAVEEEGGRILHRLAGPSALRPGGEASLVLDGARRRDHSEQHSAQHLLSSVLLRLFGAETRSFHLGAGRSTIDVTASDLDRGDLDAAEALADEAIAEDYRVLTHLCPPEDPGAFPLRKKLPEGEVEFRIVELDGIDFTPCRGTHVASLGELGLVKILGSERYKGMSRVSFVSGARARAAFARLQAAAEGAAAALGSAVEDIAAEAGRVAARLREAGLERRRLVEGMAALRSSLAGSASGAGPLLLRLDEAGDAEAAQETAKVLSRRGRTCLVLGARDLVACAARAERGGDPGTASDEVPEPRLGELLGPLALAAGGKGGGGAATFRASFPDRAALDRFATPAREALGAREIRIDNYKVYN